MRTTLLNDMTKRELNSLRKIATSRYYTDGTELYRNKDGQLVAPSSTQVGIDNVRYSKSSIISLMSQSNQLPTQKQVTYSVEFVNNDHQEQHPIKVNGEIVCVATSKSAAQQIRQALKIQRRLHKILD